MGSHRQPAYRCHCRCVHHVAPGTERIARARTSASAHLGNDSEAGDNGAVPAPPAVALLHHRAELLRAPSPDEGELAEVTEALRAQLDSGCRIRRIEMDGSPDAGRDPMAAEHLASLEPVNPVAGRADMRRRFGRDRRVFVLVHEALGDLPANIVWVALQRGLPDSLGDVLDPDAVPLDPATADTAVYYSIWNVQPGLAGMGGGRELIESAARLLSGELPQLATHVTLSPVPGFRRWLAAAGHADTSAPAERATLCAHYLTSMRTDGRPVDPVARFHLGNGARLLRVLEDADPSALGMQRSWGVMANYRYEPEDRAANRDSLAAGDPAVGESVAQMLHR